MREGVRREGHMREFQIEQIGKGIIVVHEFDLIIRLKSNARGTSCATRIFIWVPLIRVHTK